MKWLKRMLGLSGVDAEAVMDHALRLVQSGRHVEAVSQMQSAVASVKAAAGCPSTDYAGALFNLAMLNVAIGDMAHGAADCRLAADCCPATAAGRKNRLMYLMNAGQLLARCGKIESAIDVLETSLHEREVAYGPEHAGTAYGQQSLADVLLAAGRFDEGLALAEQALAIFSNQDHREHPAAIATAAALASAAGREEDEIWRYLPDRSTAIAKPMVDSALILAESMPEDTGMRFLRQLSDWAADSLPPDSAQAMDVVALWSNIATLRGNNGQRKMALQRAVMAARQMDDPAVVVNALEGYAMMLWDVDAPTGIVHQAYRTALAHANEHGLTADAANVLRAWALFESNRGSVEEATARFNDSLERAEASGDEEMIARTLIAMGIFHQHQNHLDQAAELLERGVERLDPMHPDVACAMLHQVAMAENLCCPCQGGDEIEEAVLSQLAEKFFAHSGLDGIIESVSIASSEDDDRENGQSARGESRSRIGLQVQLSREPSDDELRRIGIANTVFQNLLSSDGPMR